MKNRINKIMEKFHNMNNKKKIGISVGILVLIALAIIIPISFAALEPVKSVIITSRNTSYEEKQAGSWQITKSAKWIKKGMAEITFDVDTVFKSRKEYTDILFVFDISASMSGEKLDKVKSDATELTDYILKNTRNRVGLITFDTDSTIVSEFTSNKEQMIETINNLGIGNTTNYYQALVNVDKVLKNYAAEENRDCIILFLTDGYPNEDIPNEETEYRYLKSQYPFITINGIQYEMGGTVLDPIKKVSDYQYIADMESLHNVLFDAAVVPVIYENFEITDFIDTNYFTVDNENDIKVSEGKVVLDKEKQTVNWKMNSLRSGNKATMTIKVKLKDTLIGKGGVYPTNEKEEITSKIDNQEENETSTKTPVLADNYKVTYDANTPEGCEVTGVIPNEETRSVFDVVALSEEAPKCEGYDFKGWSIATSGVKKVNSDYFIMPESNVEIKATWGRVKLTKSMEGTVSVVQTFYKMMKSFAVPDDEKSTYVSAETGIDFGKGPSTTNGKGVYLRAPTKNDEHPVLYYRGDVNDNNVKFANFCWKIVRTTSTGGIKLVYNGEPDADGNCTNTIGEVTQIGKSKFNQNNDSPADVGYMYGNRSDYTKRVLNIPTWYKHAGKSLLNLHMTTYYNMSTGITSYYGDSVEWDGGKYTLKNKDGSTVIQIEWGSDTYQSLKGKYRCATTTATSCTNVLYVTSVESSREYVKSLSDGQTFADLDNKVWNYGSEVVYENGVYTIQNPTELKETQLYSSLRSPLEETYVCPDGTTNCSAIWYVVDSDRSSIDYVLMRNGETYESVYQQALNRKWIYGNDVEWDGSKYVLIDTYNSSPLNLSNDRKTIATKYHYSCFSVGNSCTEVNYVYDYTGRAYGITYFKFKDGKKLEDVKSEMFANTNDSTIKQTIDNWYAAHMLDYTNKLEDTIWCNDRSVYAGPLKSKDEDSSIANQTEYTYFGAVGRNERTYTPSLECENKNDSFTVSSENGNGKLIYPIALLTADESVLAGNGYSGYSTSSYLYTNQANFLLSPYLFGYFGGWLTILRESGSLVGTSLTTTYGVRPAISLAPGTIIASGDGTATDPYIVDMSENESK